MDLDQEVQRLGELDGRDMKPQDRAAAQMAVIIDEACAQVLRNARTGGRSLREAGFTAIADELERWRHD